MRARTSKAGPHRGKQMKQAEIYCGIDVSKDELELAISSSKSGETYSQTPKGIKKLVGKLKRQQPKLVVVEATGGWERKVVRALSTAGLPVVVMNPRRVRDFAKAMGKLAKTDKIDSGILALFGERIQPKPRVLATREEEALKDAVHRREQLQDVFGDVGGERPTHAGHNLRLQRLDGHAGFLATTRYIHVHASVRSRRSSR